MGKEKKRILPPIRTVTAFLFITTQIAALGWVSASYLIALYATVRLGQPYPIETLSGHAITTLLGVNALKVLENVFEHNNGGIFGHSNTTNDDYEKGA